ncbi:hypothetical protein JXC34_04210 [Candidatus Woesearchaeota archaeon]|nr:hypothetical protein [Candidatus Woesearchaeota archaeon]
MAFNIDLSIKHIPWFIWLALLGVGVIFLGRYLELDIMYYSGIVLVIVLVGVFIIGLLQEANII